MVKDSSFKLEHYQEFKDILADYKVSSRAQAALKDLRLVLMLAPSSGGRNTIIRHQLKTGRYYYLISDTTRPPRINDGVLEQNGREYWFRSEEEMLKDLKAGEFLEAEIIHNQQVSGISIRELEKAKKESQVAITDIELQGAANINKTKPDAVVILLLPPSFNEWQKRLNHRGQMSKQELSNRMQTAKKIFESGLKENYYQYLIAEDVDQSAKIIDLIVAGKPNPHQSPGKRVLKEMLARLERSEPLFF